MTPRPIPTPHLTFHALEAGDGPLVLCLHGFPDHARSFRHQLPALAAAGFRAVAPCLRGYAPTGTPPDGRYDPLALAEDVIAIIDALGYEHAVVFGHDWGAVAAYFATLTAPTRVRRLVTAAVPYGPQFFAALATNYDQQKRSWYMMFFQSALADQALARDDFAMIERLYRDWSPGWTIPPAELEAVKACFRTPGTLGAALGYYRMTMGPAFADATALEANLQGMSAPITVPGLVFHGADDGCIGADLVPPMAAYFPKGLRVEIVPGAGHFVHQERPEEVNRILLEFLEG
jgi:pimeloyl-ACP methyl ester carboxylesterase